MSRGESSAYEELQNTTGASYSYRDMYKMYMWSLTSVPFGEIIGKAGVAGNADVRLVGENGTCRLPMVKKLMRVEAL